MASDDRIGQPINISDMFLKIGRNIADTQLERGDITKEEYDEIIKILYPKPKIARKDGGIVQMNKGGDPLLGKLIANLKNKPKLASATETMTDVIQSLDEPKDVVVERQTTKTSNVLKDSGVMRKMGPEVIEVFEKAGITKAQIAKIQKVPNINDYLDDFDGFNKAMKKYRTTALKGLDKDQLAAIQKTGYLSGYKTNIMDDIMKKGASYNPKSKKYTIKPKYKNALYINKKGEPAIKMAFQNKYLDDNFDYVFKTKASATGVTKPKIQSQVYSKIQDIGKKTLNKAQQLNLDFALAQVDKLFKTAPDKAKKILKQIAKGVKTGRLFMAGGPMTFLAESIAMDPEFQKMLSSNPAFSNLFGQDMEPQFFNEGGSAKSSKNISDENLMLIEKVLTDMYKKQGGPLDDSQVIRLALDLAKAKSIGDKEVNFGGTSEDNINLLIDGITMMQGSALEKAKATDRILTIPEAIDSTKSFITRGMNKLSRTFD
tara:strand:+ start:41 stop:1501 length:1461 start_codon:yes stop_codon:yes gene_type:complete